MYSNISEVWPNEHINEIPNKLPDRKIIANSATDKIPESQKKVDLSEINSTSFMSDNLLPDNLLSDYSLSEFGSYAPAKFDKYQSFDKLKKKYKYAKTQDNDPHIPSTTACNHVTHMKKCDQCYDNLKNLINSKVSKKFDELMLDYKLKQLQNINQPKKSTEQYSNSRWKETLIIISGVIIAMFIIFLIIKSIHK